MIKSQTKYVVRRKGVSWRRSFATLAEAKQYATTAWEFNTAPNDVYFERVYTEKEIVA